MRYFEIVKPSARHISANADRRERTVEEPCCGRELGVGAVENRQDATANLQETQTLINRQSRRRHLSSRRSQ